MPQRAWLGADPFALYGFIVPAVFGGICGGIIAFLSAKLSGRAIRRRDDELHLLYRAIEQSPVSVVITDHDGSIEYVNPKFSQTTQYTYDEVLGENPRILKSGKQPPAFYQGMWETLTKGENWQGEFSNKRKSGELYLESASISPIRDAAGRITHYIAVKEDITEHRQSEEERLRLDARLQQLQFLYELRTRVRGRTPDEIIQRTGDLLMEALSIFTSTGIRVQFGERSWTWGPAGQTDPPAYTRSLTWGKQERGQLQIWCATSLTEVQERTLLDEVVAQLTRVLEARELELQLLQSSRLVSLGQMAAGVAHELNQPLAAISATAEGIVLRQQEGIEVSADRVQRMMQRVMDNVERMSSIIEHLRVFSRDAAEEPPLPVSVNEVIRSALDLIGTQLRNRGVLLSLDLDPRLPLVSGHGQQLEQVVLNLLSNARDALDAREEKLNEEGSTQTTWEKRIDIISRCLHGTPLEVMVEVADHGIGIRAEDQLRIFDPFFTTKGPDHGTGLGLSISHGIVERHKGRISCGSHTGEGAIFQILLPARMDRDAAHDAP